MAKWLRSSIRYKWTAYFLAVLLIPLIFNTVAYLIYSEKIEDELNTKNSLFYENVANELETEIARYRKVAIELAANPALRNLGSISSASAPTEEEAAAFRNALTIFIFITHMTSMFPLTIWG